MSDRYDPSIFQQQPTMRDVMIAMTESAVAASLAAAFMKRGDDGPDEAIAVYRHILAKLRESGGL